eukprot:490445_1
MFLLCLAYSFTSSSLKMMISLYFISCIALIGSNHALLSDILDDNLQSQLVGCPTDARNCLKDPGSTGDANTNYRSNEIMLKDVKQGEDGECCYRYESYYTNNPNCEGQITPQSQWTIATVCKDSSVEKTIRSDTAWHEDNNCNKGGIAFDSVCDEGSESPCSYTLCIKYSNHNGKCCTKPSWYSVQSGNAVAFGEIQAPSCHCETPHIPRRVLLHKGSRRSDSEETDDPTRNPTKYPTNVPTRDPSESPTKFPTVTPTKNPSASPSKEPSVSPSKYPTRFPSVSPSKYPTVSPSKSPTRYPTKYPTKYPTQNIQQFLHLNLPLGIQQNIQQNIQHKTQHKTQHQTQHKTQHSTQHKTQHRIRRTTQQKTQHGIRH